MFQASRMRIDSRLGETNAFLIDNCITKYLMKQERSVPLVHPGALGHGAGGHVSEARSAGEGRCAEDGPDATVSAPRAL